MTGDREQALAAAERVRRAVAELRGREAPVPARRLPA